MKRTGAGGFSAVCRVAQARRTGTRNDPGAMADAKQAFLLELQWQGRNGKFRHFVLSPRGLRRVLGVCAIVISVALSIAGALTLGSNRTQADFDVNAILRENAELKAREIVLRERAIDLAEQLYWRVELGRRMARLLNSTDSALDIKCPRPPAGDADDETVLAWFTEQSSRLEAIEDQLTLARIKRIRKWASITNPVDGTTAPHNDPTIVLVADMGSAK